MKTENSINVLATLGLLCCVVLGCKSLGGSSSTENSPPANSSSAPANQTKPDSTTGKKIDNSGLEKPDFTVTSEELDKEFTREGVTDKDLAKYENKNIAVSGRVSMLVLEKTGTVQPWVTLYAPGTLHGVSCYFDDKNASQLKLLKEDQMARVQGFQNDFIVPKVSPRLEHCVVLEAK